LQALSKLDFAEGTLFNAIEIITVISSSWTTPVST
jgi:hypothetical protein